MFESTIDNIGLAEKDVTFTSIGDSLSFGIGDTDDHGYLGDVKKLYESKCNFNVNVEDYGVPDDTSRQLLARLETINVKEALSEANIIIVNIGTNDFLNSVGTSLFNLNTEKLQSGKKIYRSNLKKTIAKIRRENRTAPIYFVGLYNPYPEKLADTRLSRVIADWNNEIKSLASEKKNINYIGTQKLFKGKEKATYFSDSLHPNELGYKLVSNKIFSEIKENACFNSSTEK
ncbi:GDSL-type esterase/lipase family protein [Pseudalkalibacillus caeni]|nr:GDSL-type esterase/lipase family protein [Pseudalkalibacillus caeni]